MKEHKVEDFLDVAERCLIKANKTGGKILNKDGTAATIYDLALDLCNSFNSEEMQEEGRKFFETIKNR